MSDLQTTSDFARTSDLSEDSGENIVTQSPGDSNRVEARTIAANDGSEAQDDSKEEIKLKVEKMLRAKFKVKDIVAALKCSAPYVYKIKEKLAEKEAERAKENVPGSVTPSAALITPEQAQHQLTAETNIRKQDFLLCLYKNNGIALHACREFKLDYRTYIKWCKEDPKFKQRVDEIREIQVDLAEESLMKQIKNQVPSSTQFFLRSRGRHRGYSEKVDIEANVVTEVRVIEPAPKEPIYDVEGEVVPEEQIIDVEVVEP